LNSVQLFDTVKDCNLRLVPAGQNCINASVFAVVLAAHIIHNAVRIYASTSHNGSVTVSMCPGTSQSGKRAITAQPVGGCWNLWVEFP